MKNLAAVIAFIIAPVAAFGGWSLPADRAIVWQGNVGVKGGIPNRTTICSTVTDTSGDAQFRIQSAINGCSTGLVSLGTGTFTLNSGLSMKANVTLRGQGPDTTVLNFTNTAANYNISIRGGYTNWPNTPVPVNMVSGYTKGSTTVELASTGDFSVGDHVYMTDTDDPNIPVYSDECTYCGVYGSSGRTRLQLAEVTAVTSTNISVDPPLYYNYGFDRSPQAKKTGTYMEYAGVEDLSIVNAGTTKTGYRYGVWMQGAANSWVKNVRIENLGRMGVLLDLDCFRIEIRDSYFYDCIDHINSDTCYGVNMSASSANLIENNIFHHVSDGANMNASSGNVIAYNYLYDVHRETNETSWFWSDQWTHGSHPVFNLYEGNHETAICFDNIHGSSSHNVAFRNRLRAYDPDIAYGGYVQMTAALTIARKNHYITVVGNVAGQAGRSDTYENLNTGNWTNYAIWGTGYLDDQTCFDTLLRHMNYDYYTNGTHTCGSTGEPGCQGGNADTDLPDSLYLTSKPAWFGTLTWPPINPTGPTVGDIPAKVRFEGGVVEPAPDCTSFTYSNWGACQPDGTQTRTITESFPSGCAGGSPVTTQSCTYTPPSAENNLPTVPTLVSPADGAVVSGTSAEFRWKKSTDPDGDAITYHFYNCTDQTFSGCTPVAVAMNSRALFYAGGMGIFLVGMTFISGLTGRRRIVTLLVIVVLLAGGALLSCSKKSGDGVPIANEIDHSVTTLTPGTTYYWKVVADDGKGGTAESAVWSYSTQ